MIFSGQHFGIPDPGEPFVGIREFWRFPESRAPQKTETFSWHAKEKTHFQARTCGRRSAAPLCQNLEILWRTVPSGANGPGRREIHRGKCFETNDFL